MRIYCWMTSRGDGWYEVKAMDEGGVMLARHGSSTRTFARSDIGITSDWQHDLYRKAHPDGCELEWIEEADVADHPGLSAAYALNQAARKAAS